MKNNGKTFLSALLALAFAVGTTFTQPAYAADIIIADHHDISIIDGDTIQIKRVVYQLAGIDAPELGQACDHGGHLWLCGLAAGTELRKLIDLQAMPIKCFVQMHEKTLPEATCLIGESEISDILLKAGYVVAAPDEIPHYTALEHLAQIGTLGIWGSKFIPPIKWRQGERLPNEHLFGTSTHPTKRFSWEVLERVFLDSQKAGHAACMVKGIITDQKEKYYYGPLDNEYSSLTITPEKGERYFCGDDEAREAGWKRQNEDSQ